MRWAIRAAIGRGIPWWLTSQASAMPRGWTPPGTTIATNYMWWSATRARIPTPLLYEATIEDPKVFTRPWKIRMPLRLQKGIQILEDECEEGDNGRRHHVSLFKEAR